jgi:signal transduction histidine kinase
VRAAGTTIVTDLHALPELPPALDTAAYRVVQEAVTNALRHAPGRAITVMITVQASELLVQVSNASSGPPGPRPELRPGTGITGMQERVRTFGGTFAVEDADEDFVVRATFPLPAESQLPAERQLPAGPEPALTATAAAEHRPG